MDLLSAAPVLRLAPLEDAVAAAAKARGLDATLLKFAVALYAAVPLSAAMALLPAPAARHAYAAAAGLALYQFVFGAAYVHALAVAAGWYALMAGTARVRALDGWRHLLAALLSFAALSVRHLYRQSVTATNVDDSVVHMMLAVRLYTLAYNLHDGARGEAARLAATAADPAASAGARALAADRLARAVPALPSPLAFAGYVLNPATLLVGPALEYREYAAGQARVGGPPAGAPPRGARVAYCLATGTAFLAAQVLLGPYVAIDGVYAQAAAPPGAGRPHPLWRLAYMHAAVLALRAQYYGVWRLAEGACLLAGFGYRPPPATPPAGAGDGAASSSGAASGSDAPGPAGDWAGAQNVVPSRVDFATSSTEILRHWNMHTQSWLERYVFKRVPRPWNRWATFFASAFWHGAS
jgi:lysophospholipid acyltransferase